MVQTAYVQQPSQVRQIVKIIRQVPVLTTIYQKSAPYIEKKTQGDTTTERATKKCLPPLLLTFSLDNSRTKRF